MLKGRRSRCERATKEVQKRKVWVKIVFEERQAKDTFNYGAAVTFRKQREPFLVSTGESLTVFIVKLPQYNLILKKNNGP